MKNWFSLHLGCFEFEEVSLIADFMYSHWSSSGAQFSWVYTFYTRDEIASKEWQQSGNKFLFYTREKYWNMSKRCDQEAIRYQIGVSEKNILDMKTHQTE